MSKELKTKEVKAPAAGTYLLALTVTSSGGDIDPNGALAQTGSLTVLSNGGYAPATDNISTSGSAADAWAGVFSHSLDVKDQSQASGVASMGVATLSGSGSATVPTTQVTATTRIFLTNQALGGTAGTPYISARIAGTSFTIQSTSNADTSQIAWLLVQPF